MMSVENIALFSDAIGSARMSGADILLSPSELNHLLEKARQVGGHDAQSDRVRPSNEQMMLAAILLAVKTPVTVSMDNLADAMHATMRRLELPVANGIEFSIVAVRGQPRS